MPMHDWTRVPAAFFRSFHHSWVAEIGRSLNRTLPSDFLAAVSSVTGAFGPDVHTLHGFGRSDVPPRPTRSGAVAVRRASDDSVAAVVEVLAPDDAAAAPGLADVVREARHLIEQRVNLLILDPFPPGRRDPGGVHRAIWGAYDRTDDPPYTPPADRPLTLVAYDSRDEVTAYVEPTAVGRPLPDMPVFLHAGRWVPVPLEATYQAAWEAFPRPWKAALTAPES